MSDLRIEPRTLHITAGREIVLCPSALVPRGVTIIGVDQDGNEFQQELPVESVDPQTGKVTWSALDPDTSEWAHLERILEAGATADPNAPALELGALGNPPRTMREITGIFAPSIISEEKISVGFTASSAWLDCDV